MEIFNIVIILYLFIFLIYIYMNGYLYYNVTNRYYQSLVDTYHIPYLSLASYY